MGLTESSFRRELTGACLGRRRGFGLCRGRGSEPRATLRQQYLDCACDAGPVPILHRFLCAGTCCHPPGDRM